MSDILNKQGINSFYDIAIKNDFARKHLFRIIDLTFYTNDPSSDLSLNLTQIGKITTADLVYMTTAKLPSRTISVIKVPYAGLEFNVPGTVKYEGSDSYDIKFRLPQNHRVRTILENWTYQTFNEQTTSGAYGIPSRFSTMTAALLDNRGNEVKRYKFVGCFVVSTGDVEFDLADENNGVLDFTAKIAYQYWEASSGDSPLISGNVGINTPLGNVGIGF